MMKKSSPKASQNTATLTKSAITCMMLVFGVALLFFGCNSDKSASPKIPEPFKTPLGKVYVRNRPSEKLLQQYHEARRDYLKDTTDVELLIWYGRRTAYLGNYEDAVDIYSKGILRFPEEARLYRHRGHRYISLREFDKAISDLQRGARLIEGLADEIEPDGMPNAMNIPVSTLHGNIWYHLGLAYYLKHDYEKAYQAYLKCLKTGNNPDNLVSSTHWLYMIQRRVGNRSAADSLLAPITEDLEVIENSNYYDLCKFYKGLIPEQALIPSADLSAASDALAYGRANWYLYEGRKEKGLELLWDIVNRDSWTSFGYIAAESDLLKLRAKDSTLAK
jgi:tetratricopeptide (TPR) repeat protein